MAAMLLMVGVVLTTQPDASAAAAQSPASPNQGGQLPHASYASSAACQVQYPASKWLPPSAPPPAALAAAGSSSAIARLNAASTRYAARSRVFARGVGRACPWGAAALAAVTAPTSNTATRVCRAPLGSPPRAAQNAAPRSRCLGAGG